MATTSNAASEDRIGEYRIVRLIHAGVTAAVVEVVQESTQRRYVVKQLLESRAGDPAERKAFAFEAKLGMELRHPNLIHVIEFFKDCDQPYFVMDYFPSFHLKLPIARPTVYPMPKAHLHRIIRQAASALAYMHDQGWIHRDVKPENILANQSGETRVIDYTIAMRPRSGLSKLFGVKVPRQGTSSYMAPEQIRCEDPAPTADIYSFGVTCYELICGRPPFRAGSQQELLSKHMRERPAPLSTHNPLVTPGFNDLVMTMIQKKPEDRIASFHDFLRRFRSIRICQDDPDPAADNDVRSFS